MDRPLPEPQREAMDGWEALADEHGVFSVAEATAAGLTARDLRYLVRTEVDSGQFRRRAGLTVHERSNGLQPLDGVIDVGSAILGTGRCNGQMAALIAADAALHRQLLSVGRSCALG